MVDISDLRGLDRLSEKLQAQILDMPAHLRQFVIDGMLVLSDDPEPEPQLPQPPTDISDRQIVLAALHPRRELHLEPLNEVEQFEFSALIATPGGDRSGQRPTYNQPVTMLTIAETAAKLQTSSATVRRMIRSRRLHAFRMFKTLRVRSDLVWALQHRPDLELEVGLLDPGPAYRPNHGTEDPFKGVPLDQVAATLRVSPQTLRQWARCCSKRDQLLWRHGGHGENTVVMSATLALHRIPFDDSQLRFVKRADTAGLSPAAKRMVEAGLRAIADAVSPEEVRRNDNVVDAASGVRMHSIIECALLLNLTVSGARKAITRAGIPTYTLGGRTRVRDDDLAHLAVSRANAQRRRRTPWKAALTPTDPQLLSAVQAAQQLGVTVRTLRRWIAAKKITGVIRDAELWVRTCDVRSFGSAADREACRTRDRTAKAAVRARGATLTEAHVEKFLTWLYSSAEGLNAGLALQTRAQAAQFAGCRPSMIEKLVGEGLIPAQRLGRKLRIRTVDLVAAGVFSAKVARLCPNLKLTDVRARRNVISEFLSLEQAAPILGRPVSEVRRLIAEGVLHGVRFGRVHRLHDSEVSGPGLARFHEVAPPFEPLKHQRNFTEVTVNEAANSLGLSERTVLRWTRRAALLGAPATRQKWKQSPSGAWMKRHIPVNRNGMLISSRSVMAARRMRQVRGLLPRDIIEVTQEQLSAGNLPQLQPWQEFLLVPAWDAA